METIKDVKLTGKTAIITGSNCGIGYETALGLAKRGLIALLRIIFKASLILIFYLDATVIVACRDEKKAIEAVAKIKEASQNEKIEYELLNLSSLKSIKQCADKIKAKYKRIDILINNAGNYLRLNKRKSQTNSYILFNFRFSFGSILKDRRRIRVHVWREPFRSFLFYKFIARFDKIFSTQSHC